jgi:hemoglobin/transferrin/lactoferrin receptor protein
MKRQFMLSMQCFGISFVLNAQVKNVTDTLQREPVKLNEVVVYANKFPETPKTVAQYVQIIKNKSALNLQPNTADVLLQSGSVFVQKSQQGGGSPVIRGFEASRVLLMVDGVRMNNAIYRAGHLQNIITVDNMVLDRLEVLYGPSSTLYGSDALGGVVNLFTKNPVLSLTDKTKINNSATIRYATANKEMRGNVLVNVGGRQWGSLTSFTYSSFADLVQGTHRMSHYPDFGKKPFFVKRFENTDSAVVNPNPNKQVESGYKQFDMVQKLLYQPKPNISHMLNLQFSNTSDVPRYDRLTESNNGYPVYAEWYYGPQTRNLTSYQFKGNKLSGFFSDVAVTASYQHIDESRISRRFKSNSKDFRWEQVQIFGITGDAKHYDKHHELHLGVESYHNFVRSTAERRNIVTNVVSPIATRYSNGPTSMCYHAVYAQHTYKFSDRLTLNEGLRLNLVKLDAIFADTTLMHFPFNSMRQNNLAITGNLGLVYSTPENFRLGLMLSSGFRSPNVDDLAKVFESKTGTLIVPNPEIKPEYTYNTEINFNRYGDHFTIGGALFYTWFRNAIVTDQFHFNGNDSINYIGIKSAVLANQNKAKAFICGSSVNAAYHFTKNTSVNGVFTYTHGRYYNNGMVPLDHIPPAYGRLSVKHAEQKWNTEIFTLFNGWKRMDNYNPYGEDNEQYATKDGMPAWYTVNLRVTAHLGLGCLLQLTLENMLDRNYRYFASGISAPGRNFVVSLKSTF